mgnify:CR=1 FL=1
MLKPILSAVGKTVLVSTLLSLIVCAFLPADVRLIAVVAIFSGCALALIPILRQVVNAPQTEAAQRKAAADALFDPIHPDRMWFHVGWDDTDGRQCVVGGGADLDDQVAGLRMGGAQGEGDSDRAGLHSHSDGRSA